MPRVRHAPQYQAGTAELVVSNSQRVLNSAPPGTAEQYQAAGGGGGGGGGARGGDDADFARAIEASLREQQQQPPRYQSAAPIAVPIAEPWAGTGGEGASGQA